MARLQSTIIIIAIWLIVLFSGCTEKQGITPDPTATQTITVTPTVTAIPTVTATPIANTSIQYSSYNASIDNIVNHGPYTAFLIREFDFPKEWSHGEVEVAEITPEELSQYPILQNLLSGDCTKYDTNWWRCNVKPDEWNKTKNFINTKENTDVCIKIGEKCYTMTFG